MALNKEQLDSLKQAGRANLAGGNVVIKREYAPTKKIEEILYIYNGSTSPVHVADLNFDISPYEMIYLPNHFEKDKIRASRELSRLVFIDKMITAFFSDEEAIGLKIEKEQKVADKFPEATTKGSHELLDENDNPYTEAFKKLDGLEVKATERMQGKR
jgi:hypothetical protein